MGAFGEAANAADSFGRKVREVDELIGGVAQTISGIEGDAASPGNIGLGTGGRSGEGSGISPGSATRAGFELSETRSRAVNDLRRVMLAEFRRLNRNVTNLTTGGSSGQGNSASNRANGGIFR